MKLINVNKDKCVNCFRCIAVCPVKYCNNASSNFVDVDENLCIQCGRCIFACKHDARYYLDDFDDFISKSHDNLIFIIDSSALACFGDNLKKFISFLRNSLKGRKVLDAGFGAEIIAMKYIDHIDKKKPNIVISQHCPVIVKYVETYKYKLMGHLAPIDSPAMAVARYMREFRSFNGEIAFISPCIAKAIEFKDDNTGKCINYNLTFPKILQYLQNRKIIINDLPEEEFDEFEAEKGAGISRPGGLKDILLKYKDMKVKQVQGEIVYDEYFDELIRNLETNKPNPAVIDVLNCRKGCNFGPGTVKNFSSDEVDDFIDKRIKSQQKKLGGPSKTEKYFKQLKNELGASPFERKYSRKHFSFDSNTIKEDDLLQIYAQMHKINPEDFKQCRACGYRSCREMAVAIKLGLNKKENCYFYIQDIYKDNLELIKNLSIKINESFLSMSEKITNIKKIFSEVTNSYNMTYETLININKSNEILVKLSMNFTPIVEAITDISDQTHLLSLNAAIEAARAGTAGKGFAIVAHEVDILSAKASEEVEKITPMVKDLIQKITKINKRGEVVIQDLDAVRLTLNTFSDNIKSISGLMTDLTAIIKNIQK